MAVIILLLTRIRLPVEELPFSLTAFKSPTGIIGVFSQRSSNVDIPLRSHTQDSRISVNNDKMHYTLTINAPTLAVRLKSALWCSLRGTNAKAFNVSTKIRETALSRQG